MITVSAALPGAVDDRPPIVLVHGAASSAPVWTFWVRKLVHRGWPTYAVNLRAHGPAESIDLSSVGMEDYAADVATLARQLRRRPVLVGWSLGGLVGMMVAASGLTRACVGLAPSMPARTADPSVVPRAGEFGAEEYGITSRDPDDQPAMPDFDREERAIALAALGRE